MARNKYPEETIERILSVSLDLFIEKGYDNTSIKEIVEHLGGLSKGAIYHHFNSKEEILEAVFESIYAPTEQQMTIIKNDPHLNGLAKLQKMFSYSINHPDQAKIFTASPKLLNNPNLLTMQLSKIINDAVPRYILPVIEQGLADGSIKTDYPKQLGEVMMLLVNLWINPLVFEVPADELVDKIRFYDLMLKGLGLHILDDNLYDKFIKLNHLSSR